MCRLHLAFGVGQLPIGHGIHGSGGPPLGLVVVPCFSQIGIHGGPIGKVEGNRAVGLFQAEHGKCLGDAFGGLALEKGVHDGIQGNSRASNPVAAVSLLNLVSNHPTVLSCHFDRGHTKNLATAKSTGASTPALILGWQCKMVYGARAVAALTARASRNELFITQFQMRNRP